MAYKPPPRAGATVHVWANYSLQERERRWQAVREGAARQGFDCIFVPLGNGTDARYLTQLRCSSVIMPTDGRPPIIVADRSSRNDWVPEPWQTSREWAEPMAEALLEAGMQRARIGVAGLRGGKVTHVRSTAGVVNHTAFSEVMRRLPNARFEDATDVVGFVRYVKSSEEVECMREAVAIAEAGIEEIARTVHPGLDEAVLYARVLAAMLERGTEYYPLVITTGMLDGSETMRSAEPPLDRRLKAATLIRSEVNAVRGTQIAEEDQAVLLGAIPDQWKPVIERHRENFQAGLSFMKPGTACSEIVGFAQGLGQRDGMRTEILLQGRGMGDDGPVIKPATQAGELKGLRFDKNTVWLWRPTISSADGKIRFSWGTTVLVTEQGGEPLSKRPHGMTSIG